MQTSPFESTSSTESGKRTPRNAFQLLQQNSFKNAKMKGVKIYTDSEIQQARSDLERKRRLFWNEKMEQLCSDPKQARHDKTTLCGMVDVSWTLRKSGMLETEANKVLYQEQVVLRGGEATTKKKLGPQKRETNPKNMDRMNAAHQQVETLDGALINYVKITVKQAAWSKRRKLKKSLTTKLLYWMAPIAG